MGYVLITVQTIDGYMEGPNIFLHLCISLKYYIKNVNKKKKIPLEDFQFLEVLQ